MQACQERIFNTLLSQPQTWLPHASVLISLSYHAEFIPFLSTIDVLESSLLEDMAPLAIQFYLFVNLIVGFAKTGSV